MTIVEAVQLIEQQPESEARQRARAAVLSARTTHPPDEVGGGPAGTIRLVWHADSFRIAFSFHGPSLDVEVARAYPLDGDDYPRVHVADLS